MSSCCLFESFRLRFVVPRLRSGSTFGWSARSNCRRRSLVSRDSTSRSISSLVSRYEKGRAETDVATSPETPALRTATGTAPRRCPRGSRFHTRFHSRPSGRYAVTRAGRAAQDHPVLWDGGGRRLDPHALNLWQLARGRIGIGETSLEGVGPRVRVRVNAQRSCSW